MPFIHSLSVTEGDIDYLGHAGSLAYLRWVQDAAIAHSTALGLAATDYLARGEAWVVRRHQIDYLRPAMAGDRLRIETWVATLAAANSVRQTRILRESDGALLCSASTDWVYVRLAKARPIRIPDEVRALFPLEEL